MILPDLLPNLKELDRANLVHLSDALKKDIALRKEQFDLVYDELIRRYCEDPE